MWYGFWRYCGWLQESISHHGMKPWLNPLFVGVPHSFQGSFCSGNRQTPSKTAGFLKRPLVEKNGEPTPRTEEFLGFHLFHFSRRRHESQVLCCCWDTFYISADCGSVELQPLNCSFLFSPIFAPLTQGQPSVGCSAVQQRKESPFRGLAQVRGRFCRRAAHCVCGKIGVPSRHEKCAGS